MQASKLGILFTKLLSYKVGMRFPQSFPRHLHTNLHEPNSNQPTSIKEKFKTKRLETQQKFEDKKKNIKERRNETKTRIKMNLFDRFFEYLKSYGTFLEKAFPDSLVKTYRVFSTGSTALLQDMKTFSRVQHVITTSSDTQKAFRSFSRHELEVYQSLPRDLVRVAPVLLVSMLPLAQNVVFPLALLYPRTFLSSQFWNQAQRSAAATDDLTQRRRVQFAVLEALQYKLSILRQEKPYLYDETRHVLNLMMSGSHPTPAQILTILPLFSPGGVYHLINLTDSHARLLVKLHGLQGWWPHRRLKVHGRLLLAMDRAVDREGVGELDDDMLARCCHLRGVERREREKMLEYLDKWVEVSRHLNDDNISLLLHLPLFLGYNYNREL